MFLVENANQNYLIAFFYFTIQKLNFKIQKFGYILKF
jgi:hypothetical protein